SVAGSASGNVIAKWSGSSWSALGSGTDNLIEALTVGGGALYAGGYFTNAGAKSSIYFDAWECGVVSVGGRPARATFESSAPWPNPSSRTASVDFDLPAAAIVHADVFDVAGHRVSSPIAGVSLAAGPHHLTWDGRDGSG